MPLQDSQTVIARCRELAAISETNEGTFRTFLSPAMKRCYEVVGGWLRSAGMTVNVDAAGNLRGVLAGRDPGKRVFVMGSHLDTVRNAGAFDGILGVVMAIALAEGTAGLPFDIEVVGFSEEEGVRFSTPFIGSRALVGTLDAIVLQKTDAQGISIAQAICDFGLDPTCIPQASLMERAIGFLEFHIEQGPVLDDAGESVAIVEAVVGQRRALMKFVGSANHAGTTPMRLRRDALAAAAEWIGSVESLGSGDPDLVTTVGKLDVQPNIANVIPGEAAVSLDVRHIDDSMCEAVYLDLKQHASDIAKGRKLAVHWTDTLNIKTVEMDDKLLRSLIDAAPRGTRRMASGAGHDAMILAPHIPSAMLFLRSPGGVSHHPAETVLPQDVDLALAIGRKLIESLRVEYSQT